MLVIGLTGGIGSGKSTVTNYFTQEGINIVDADIFARQIVVPGSDCLTEITAAFGEQVILENGQLNRSKMRDIIFNDEQARYKLESITHPVIRSLIVQSINNSTSSYTILSSPLLFETDQVELVNRTLVIDLPPDLQILRVTQRDNITADQAHKIINTQISRAQRLKLADDILDNSGDLINTKNQVTKLHQKYLKLVN